LHRRNGWSARHVSMRSVTIRNMSIRLRLQIPAIVLGFAALPTWAAELRIPGLPHFFQVSDHIYRGGQPTGEGWAQLAKLGVKTVIDLRREGEDGEHSTKAEAKAVEAAGMQYVHVPMNGIVAPSDEQIARIMTFFRSKEPVFVHCKKGKDR